jgi:hypothetical protein
MIPTTLYDDFYEVRRAVQEAFSKESVFVPERTQMLNALQGILEKCEHAKGTAVEIDFEDLFILYKNRDVINDAAHIHEAFMGNTDLAESLRQIVKNIEKAQANNWTDAKSGA